MSGRCPVCNSYSCRCSDYHLREFRSDHQFDRPRDVLQMFEIEDKLRTVERELLNRREREMEIQQAEAALRRKQQEEERQAEDAVPEEEKEEENS